MALDNFKKTSMRIDKANQRFLDYQNAKVGDINGRELLVQITNNGVVEDQTGTTLKLNWQHENGNQGSTNFNVVDIKTGKYSLYYPSKMLYKGTVDASVEINSNGRITNTMNFKIIVHADVFNGEAGTVDGVFISLADVNKKLDDREKEYVELKNRQTSVETQFNDIQQDITDKDVISAPEIIAARNGEENLKARLDKEYQEVSTQLADIVQQIPKQTIPTSKLQKIKNKLNPPTNFVWKDAPINIYKSGDGTITTDLDASTFKHVGAGKVYYVNVNTGNNANDGLTPETALKSIYVARLKSDVDIIEVADGFYDDSNGFNNINASSSFKNLTIRSAIGADVTISTARKLTWTKTVGKTNVYQTTRSLFVSVWDSTNLDANGDYINLISVSSIDLCDTTPNSYYYDGSILYVHTYNSRVADTNLLVFLDLYNFSSKGNYRIYFENIKFYGGKNGCIGVSNTENGALVVAKNCEFKYSSAGSGGVTTLGYDTIMQNCICAKNYADGFNYHKNGLKLCNSIEVDCIGRSNGLGRGTDTDNGSTTHDGCKIIRINGNYHSNEGPNVHDIFTGTESWNVGCESHDSKGIASNRNANYFSEDNAKVFLEDCIGYDSIRAFYIASTGFMYQRNCLFDDGLQSNNGVLESF